MRKKISKEIRWKKNLPHTPCVTGITVPRYFAVGKEKVEEVGQKIFELVVNTASGNKSKSEINGYGDEEFNPWQVGVVM